MRVRQWNKVENTVQRAWINFSKKKVKSLQNISFNKETLFFKQDQSIKFSFLWAGFFLFGVRWLVKEEDEQKTQTNDAMQQYLQDNFRSHLHNYWLIFFWSFNIVDNGFKDVSQFLCQTSHTHFFLI